MNYADHVECYLPKSEADNSQLFCIYLFLVSYSTEFNNLFIQLEYFHGHDILTSTYNFFRRCPSQKAAEQLFVYCCFLFHQQFVYNVFTKRLKSSPRHYPHID